MLNINMVQSVLIVGNSYVSRLERLLQQTEVTDVSHDQSHVAHP